MRTARPFRSNGGNMLILILVFATMLIMVTLSPGNSADINILYNELLARHVRNGLVDYSGLKKEETILDNYLRDMERADMSKFSENGRFAFYINTYNAWTLKLVLGSYPEISSIKEIRNGYGSPWKIPLIKVGGKFLTLDDIEHSILRPEFKDPRVHFAINCASRSCPPLAARAYEGTTLDKQLSEAATKFINDRENNYFKGDTLHLSRIFYWFRKDFDNDPIDFASRLARGELEKFIKNRGDTIRIRYLPYDWSLNDIHR